jgi:preflagellin peptidase FlaK
LAAGVVYDVKTREVTDKLWIVYGASGLTLTIIRTFIDASLILPISLSIGLSTLLALGLSQFALFGGADAKALICLALATPLTPTFTHPMFGYAYPFLPILVMVTAFVYSGSVVMWILGKNLSRYIHTGELGFFGALADEPCWKKAFAIMTGYPVGLRELKASIHFYPMEKITQQGYGAKRQFIFSLNIEERDELISKLDALVQEHFSEVDFEKLELWATPGLPMLLFIFISFLSSLIFGDPMFGFLVRRN